MGDHSRDIKLYHYDASPYAHKLVWYLTLRQIPYAEVKVPFVLPRPDIQQAIGVSYRRIPIMAIGKDVYCDTSLMLQKLEEFFPDGKLGATTPDAKALEQLLYIWSSEGNLFMRGVQSLPLKFFKNEVFVKDRSEMMGRPFDVAAMEKARPEALTYLRNAFSMLENLLADGREWLLKTEKPSLGDIEGIFIVEWITSIKGALPSKLVSNTIFPYVYLWIQRFHKAVEVAGAHGPTTSSLKGDKAAEQIRHSKFAEAEANVHTIDVLNLPRKGAFVEVFPTDTGSSHRDEGTLVGLSDKEIVVELENGLRLHTPRINYRVRLIGSKV